MGARGQKHVALVPNLAEPYDLQVMAGISKHVRERANWSVYVPPDPVHQVAMLENWRGDGIIANMDDPSLASVIRKKGVPAVGFGGGASFTTSRINYLATDNRAIGALGAQHLLERGFTRFGYCAMPRSARYQPWSRDRGAAFREEVEREGFSCSLFSASAEVSLDWDQLLKALIRWIESLELPAGVMAAYDLRALHVLEACRALQVRVPDELAVLGVDNQEVICELAEPKLSSIVQGGWQVGAMASELLEAMMAGEAAGGKSQNVPPVTVETRHSTDVLAIEDEHIVTAIRLIRERACEGIQVKDVVDAVSIARVTLEKRFKAILGRTMHGEIKRVQMQRVQDLLRTTDLPLQKVAEQTGFEYVEYLSNYFRQSVGMTPGQYRRLHRH